MALNRLPEFKGVIKLVKFPSRILQMSAFLRFIFFFFYCSIFALIKTNFILQETSCHKFGQNQQFLSYHHFHFLGFYFL